MKKTMIRILLLAAAMVLAMSLCLAYAEEVPAEEAAVSTTAYLFWQDEDWWPAVGRNEDEYWTPTPATVTGEGYYTVAVQGHMPGWFYPSNSNRGAQKLAVVIADGATLFPGYYMQITDIRINGVSYPCGDVTYGQTGYDNADGTNIFWSANDSYGLIYDQWMIDNNGTTGGVTWNSAATPEKYDVFDVSVLNNPGSIEIDFFLSTQQDVKPAGGPALRVLTKGPELLGDIADPSNLPTVPDNATDAKMFWIASGWWPSTDIPEQVSTQSVTITGAGKYTTNVSFPDQGGWSFAGQGSNAIKLGIVIEDAFGENSIMEGKYVGISDVRINGQSIAVSNPGYGIVPAEDYSGEPYDGDDGVVLLYHEYIAGLGNDYQNWEGEQGNARPLDGTTLGPINSIEVDFFVTDTVGELPKPWAPQWDRVWYPNNTMGVAGISLRDQGITDKWYNVVPVDLTTNGIYQIPMVASNLFQIGNAFVAVQDGEATVTYETYHASYGNLVVGDEVVAWFDSIEDITDEFCDAPTSEIAFGEAVDVSELGNVGYLFICNGVTYSQPITNNGVRLPRYLPNDDKMWFDYRASLNALIAELEPAVEEAPAEEVPAE